MRRRFVLLDRDGTINVDKHYISRPEQVELLPGAAAGLKELSRLGLGLIVITNQSGIGRGYFDEPSLHAVHERLQMLLREADVSLDAIYYCPHDPSEGCECRKPAAGLIRQAVADFSFDPSEAFVVGDKSSDIELGQAVGATTLYVGETILEPVGGVQPDHEVRDLVEAAAVIARLLAAERILECDSKCAATRGAEELHA